MCEKVGTKSGHTGELSNVTF